MKSILSVLLLATISLASLAQTAAPQTATAGQPAVAPKPITPRALVVDLYRQHNRKRGPFFQTKNRAQLDKYFTKRLAGMIWKDMKGSRGEVGALDGDPLYNAQDMEIKHFVIGKTKYESGKTEVWVTFENFGKKTELVFQLVKGKSGWRIADIKYDDGSTLAGILRADAAT